MILAATVASCTPSGGISQPIVIISPSEGADLQVGGSFRLNARMAVDYPITSIGVRLWDVASEYETSWRFETPSRSAETTLDVELAVPLDAPIGDDYRLDVSASPGYDVSTTPQLSAAEGFTVVVHVNPAQP
jgi:hypothetical protein